MHVPGALVGGALFWVCISYMTTRPHIAHHKEKLLILKSHGMVATLEMLATRGITWC